MQTIIAAELTSVNSFGLPSLALPLEMETAGMLVALTLSTALVFLLTLKRRDVITPFLLASASFFAQVSGRTGQIRDLRRYLIPWLLLAGVASAFYTNFLQSIVVIPGTVHSDLSLEEMIRQNFTFLVSNHAVHQLISMRAQVETLEEANATRHSVGWHGHGHFQKMKKLAEKTKVATNTSALALIRDLATKSKTAFVSLGVSLRARMLKAIGRNAVIGEPLVTQACFMAFNLNEKSEILRS